MSKNKKSEFKTTLVEGQTVGALIKLHSSKNKNGGDEKRGNSGGKLPKAPDSGDKPNSESSDSTDGSSKDK